MKEQDVRQKPCPSDGVFNRRLQRVFPRSAGKSPSTRTHSVGPRQFRHLTRQFTGMIVASRTRDERSMMRRPCRRIRRPFLKELNMIALKNILVR